MSLNLLLALRSSWWPHVLRFSVLGWFVWVFFPFFYSPFSVQCNNFQFFLSLFNFFLNQEHVLIEISQ